MSTVVVMKRRKTVEMTESRGRSLPILWLGVLYCALAECSSSSSPSSILNVPGESTLRRDFQRLQQENKERSEAHKRQQAQLAAQRRDPEEHKRQLLHDRQKRIEEQKEQRRRIEEVESPQ